VSFRKIMALGAVGVATAAGIAVVSVPGMSKPIQGLFGSSRRDIITYTVRPANLNITVSERGSLESSSNLDVFCEVEGQTTIISIVPEGKRVKKGDVVCELDSAALRDSLTNQKISTQSADAAYQNAVLTREVAEIAVTEYEEGTFVQELQTVEGEIKLAESDLTRSDDRVVWATKMYDKGYVSKAQKVSEELAFQKARFALEQAQSKKMVLEKYTRNKTVKELKSEVEKARSDELAKKQTYELEKSKEEKLVKQIEKCKLIAPGDGLVVYANDPNRAFGNNQPQVEEGATVRERQKIFSLPDIGRMQVNTKVHESQIDKIVPGQRTRIRVDAFADQVLNGTVKDVAPLPDPTSFFSSDIKVYTTHVTIEGGTAGLRPGMTAQVEILVDKLDDVLSVPVQAILPIKGKEHVSVKEGDRFVRREVEVGKSDDKYVQVLKGVEAGDVLAMSPISLMTEEERREAFGSTGEPTTKKNWSGEAGKGGPEGGAPGAGPDAKGGAVAAGGEAGKAKAKGRGRMGAMAGAFAKIPPEDLARLKTATPEERQEIFKKAGISESDLEQAKQQMMRRRSEAGGDAPGGGGFGGGGGGFGGGGGGGPRP
jgi:multidrug efflux pump subunit AcrA (membrane-fusion protein)